MGARANGGSGVRRGRLVSVLLTTLLIVVVVGVLLVMLARNATLA